MPSIFEPIVDPKARDPSTKFPLDDMSFDIHTISEETLISYGETAPILHSLGGVAIVRLSRNLVLKYGRNVLASEGETMKYVATAFPGVRLPKVYRCFNVDEPVSYYGVKGYIVMDYIDGHSMDKYWDQLNSDQQANAVTQIAAMVRQMQSTHFGSPGVIGGGMSRAGMSRGFWFSDYGAGPFETKEEFERWLNWKLNISKHVKQASADIPDINISYFVLVHGDLSPRNIILDAAGQIWLIDLGSAGIYPAIFEAATIKHQGHFPSFAEMLLPLVYNDPDEMRQLEGCQWGIRVAVLANPP